MLALPTHYRSQNGRSTPIAQMVDEHLVNAVAKLKRTGSTVFNSPTLVALDAERKRRGL